MGTSLSATRTFILICAALVIAALTIHGENAPKNDIIEHPVVSPSINYYGILLPPGYDDPANKNTAYPLCVLLQGSGNREEEYLKLVTDNLKRDGVIYLMPRAPYLYYKETLKQGKPVFSAYPQDIEDWAALNVPKEFQPTPLQIEKLYTDWIAQCVVDAKNHYRIQPGKVALFGHSQGAAFGFRFAVDHPELVKACFLAEGYYKSRLGDDTAATILKTNDVHLTIIHNQDDPVVGFPDGKQLVDYLEKNQVPFDHTFYPTGKHDISEPCKVQAAAFVEHWCRGGK